MAKKILSQGHPVVGLEAGRGGLLAGVVELVDIRAWLRERGWLGGPRTARGSAPVPMVQKPGGAQEAVHDGDLRHRARRW